MAKVLKRRWPSASVGSGLSRRDSRPCDYEAYAPDPLVGRRITLDGEVAADVADAEAAIVRLNAEASALVDTEGLARILLRAEAVASSWIEGLVIGARRLLHGDAVRTLPDPPSDLDCPRGVEQHRCHDHRRRTSAAGRRHHRFLAPGAAP